MKIVFPYFNNNQRKGIILLVVLIGVLQGILFLVKAQETKAVASYKIDIVTQQKIDSLKQLSLTKYKVQPFNPNFITDAKGFKLGMSTEEIDRLLAFRASGKYVNSADEFQKVTGVSKSQLAKMTPYFKFPEWLQNKKTANNNYQSPPVKKVDLNKATFNELVAIKGIGDFYANAILAERNKLNGFVSLDQLRFIKGLRPQAITVLQQHGYIGKSTVVQKINVNTASKENLEQVPYITAYLARQIVILRSKQDQPLTVEDLEKINNFPLDKLKIIRLYLDF